MTNTKTLRMHKPIRMHNSAPSNWAAHIENKMHFNIRNFGPKRLRHSYDSYRQLKPDICCVVVPLSQKLH